MANTGFFAAIQLPHLHLRPLPLIRDDDSEWSSEVEAILSEVTTTQLTAALPLITTLAQFRGSEAILPFSWLVPSEPSTRTDWEERFIEFLHGHDLIMTRRDAIAIVTTVLRELVDNVFEHAGVGETLASHPPGALIVGLGVRQGRSLAWKKPGGLYPGDLPFNEWLTHRETPLVRLLVADSGSGIPATLNESYLKRLPRRQRGPVRSGDLILHSFEASASRHTGSRRGLGLATVGRFVRGYAGRITIRSGNASGGYWYPNIASEVFVDENLGYTPGTTVEVMLGITLRGRPHGPVEQETEPRSANLAFTRCRLSELSRHRIKDIVSGALQDTDRSERPIVVLIVTGWPEERLDRINLALEVRDAAKELERKAGLATILTGASEAEIRSVFAPLDELDEAGVGQTQVWDLGEWTPPTLVIAANGAAIWTGGSESVRKLLYSLLAGHEVDLARAARSFRRGSAERDYLVIERDWLSVDENTRTRLRVTISLIDDLVARHVEEFLTAELGRGWQQWV